MSDDPNDKPVKNVTPEEYKALAESILKLDKEKMRWDEAEEAGKIASARVYNWPLSERWRANKLLFRGLKNRYFLMIFAAIFIGFIFIAFLASLKGATHPLQH